MAPLLTSEPDQPDRIDDKLIQNQDEGDASSEIREREVVLRNTWDRLATVLQMELPNFSNYVEVHEGDPEVLEKLTDQEIV